MEEKQISVSGLEAAYKCNFSEDRRTVTVVIGSQFIQPCRLQFGEDLPQDLGVAPEPYQVLLEVPIQDGFAMMAMSKISLYSYSRQQHARFGKKVDQEEFMIKLTSQIQKLVALKQKVGPQQRPVTRKPLERLVDEINNDSLQGEVESRGRQFAEAWFDKNLAKTGEVGETLFLINALTLYRNEYGRRHFQPKGGGEQE